MNVIAETTDLETAEDILSATYAPIRIHPRGLRHGLRLERAALGPMQFHHVSLGMDFDAEGDPLEALVFGELTSGQVCQKSDGSDRRYVPGEVFLAARYSDAYTSTVHGADMRLTVLDPALPSQVADSDSGRAVHGNSVLVLQLERCNGSENCPVGIGIVREYIILAVLQLPAILEQ